MSYPSSYLTLGLMTRYYFLSEGCRLKLLSCHCGAPSDERSGSWEASILCILTVSIEIAAGATNVQSHCLWAVGTE
jgi:hypothetical protein